jgi:hypothetical protein
MSTGIHLKPQRNNRSTGVAGVSSYFHVDTRKKGQPKYLRFAVCYKDASGKRRIKHFEVGRFRKYSARDRERAFKAACAFRKSYIRQALRSG